MVGVIQRPAIRDFAAVETGLGKDPDMRLQLTTAIAEQTYCKRSDPDGYDSSQLRLSAHFANVGQRSVILYEPRAVPYQQMISSSLQDARSKKYVLDVSLTVLSDKRPPNIADTPLPGKYFRIIPPGATFNSTLATGANVFLKGDDDPGRGDTFAPGEYFLQMSVFTFPYDDNVAKSLSDKWKTSGILWTSNLTSAPMPFKIVKDRKLVDCSRAANSDKSRQ